MQCTVNNCQNIAQARGLCPTHYAAARRGGKLSDYSSQREPKKVKQRLRPFKPRKVEPTICGAVDCDRGAIARGFCPAHYYKARRSGELQRTFVPVFSVQPGPAPKDPVERFNERVDKNGPIRPGLTSPCWLWTGHKLQNGYGQFNIGSKLGGIIGSHRAAHILFIGPIPKGHDVRHRCDVRACCNPEHLLSGTRTQNMQDAAKRGRTRNGGGRQTRFSPEIFSAIRSLYATGQYTYDDLAAHFKVSSGYIGSILRGQTKN